MVLRRLVTIQSIAASDSRLRALEKIERMLDEVEGQVGAG
jgi:hypothetical protein